MTIAMHCKSNNALTQSFRWCIGGNDVKSLLSHKKIAKMYCNSDKEVTKCFVFKSLMFKSTISLNYHETQSSQLALLSAFGSYFLPHSTVTTHVSKSVNEWATSLFFCYRSIELSSTKNSVLGVWTFLSTFTIIYYYCLGRCKKWSNYKLVPK